MSRGGWLRAGSLAMAGVAAIGAPVLLADQVTGDGTGAHASGLDAAAAWSDVLPGARAPQFPPPGSRESAIVVLRERPVGRLADADRSAGLNRLGSEQDVVAAAIAGLGGTIRFRYRLLVNGLGVELPTGQLAALAELPQVAAIHPVTYLAPAQALSPAPLPPPGPTRAASPPAPPAPGAPEIAAPAHLALIDAGIDADHPALGGGIGPRYPIIGGADLVDGDDQPLSDPDRPDADGHGTKMAGIVLGAPAFAGLPPAATPRLLAYRVVANEEIAGVVRPLARSDRVLAAVERAMDPDGDGDAEDAAEVVLLGVAGGFDGGGQDPLRRALAQANRLGSLIVTPAGNDGPTDTLPGTIGGPAAGASVLTVGALGPSHAPRTADLRVDVGPAGAVLADLPALGAAAGPASLPLRILVSGDRVALGDDPADYADAGGASRVAGALAVVGRGGAGLRHKAEVAAAAGAAALAVWDAAGSGVFPAISTGPEWPIPVVGLGARQGEALAATARERPDVTVSLAEDPRPPRAPRLASFSSRGPTVDGLAKPEIAAPGVEVPAPYPGTDAAGTPRASTLTGTSAAAAQVAALALRLRIDRADLTPREVRSALVQGALAVSGARLAAPAEPPEIAVAPAVVTVAPRARAGLTATVVLARLRPGAGTYSVALETAAGARRPVGADLAISGRRARAISLTVPAAPPGAEVGRLVIRDADGAVAGWAPVVAAAPAVTPADALGVPRIRHDGDLLSVAVRVGRRERVDGRVRSARLRALRVRLVTGSVDRALLAGAKQPGEWPAGEYRLALSARLADGSPLPSGRARVLVSAVGPDGRRLERMSGPFTLPE